MIEWADGRPSEPTIAELIEAIRERLETAVENPLGGFEARVARNVAAIIERELELGPAADAAHVARLRAFGVERDRDLAARIRQGELDDRSVELRRALLESAEDRLRIDNPRWLRPGHAPTIE